MLNNKDAHFHYRDHHRRRSTVDASRSIHLIKGLIATNGINNEILRNMTTAVWLKDDTGVTSVNKAFEKIWHLNAQDLIDDPTIFMACIVPEDKNKVEAAMKGISTGKPFDEEYRIEVDGEVKWIHAITNPIGENDGTHRRVGIAYDITKSKEMEQRIEYIARHDSLTQLENRTAYQENLDEIISLPEASTTSIVILDMDNLKKMNDKYGHEKGDQLIKRIGKLLKTIIRSDDGRSEDPDGIYRIGGDEFAIILKNFGEDAKKIFALRVASLVKQVQADMETEFNISEKFGLSFGIANTQEQELQELSQVQRVKRAWILADERMYFMKISESETFHSNKIANTMNELFVKEPSLKEHSNFVRKLSRKLGKLYGYTDVDLLVLEMAGYMHDVGKKYISPDTLNKIGKLSPEEWETIKKHVVYGSQIAGGIVSDFVTEPHLSDKVQKLPDIIHYSHENFDGTGYLGLKDSEIPMESQIIRITDSFHAAITHRHGEGNGKSTIEEAIADLNRYSGTRYNPELLKIFIENKCWE